MSKIVPELDWFDGMLLRPQHMQSLQRHHTGLLAALVHSRPYAYGLLSPLVVREEGIGNWVFDITACQLLTRQGTFVLRDATARILPTEFQHLKLDAPTLEVWLAIPLLRDGTRNVVPESKELESGNALRARYISRDRDERDEGTGEDAAEVRIRLLNVSIFIGMRPPDGFESFKIAELDKVITDGVEGHRYELSKSFVPASLSLDAAPKLHACVKDMLDKLERMNMELLSQLSGRDDLKRGETVEQPDSLIKLQATNGVLPLLRQLTAHSKMHPYDVYLQLTRLIGDLGIFSESWEVPKLVIYDHDDPLKAYMDLKAKWIQLLDVAIDTTIDKREFEANEVGIPAHFLKDGVNLFLGIETHKRLDEVAPLFCDARTVLTSPADLQEIQKRRMDGIPCQPAPDPHPALRNRGLVFFRVSQSGPWWDEAKKCRRLALGGDALTQARFKFYLYATNVRDRTPSEPAVEPAPGPSADASEERTVDA